MSGPTHCSQILNPEVNLTHLGPPFPLDPAFVGPFHSAQSLGHLAPGSVPV